MTRGILSIGQNEPHRWAVFDDDQLTDAGDTVDLAWIGDRLRDCEKLAVLLPGETAATRHLTLPVRGERAVQDAATLAFDDILADNVEGYVFGFSEADETNKRWITAFPRADLDEWVRVLASHRLDPDVIAADHTCLSQAETSVVILYGEGRVVASLPDGGVSGDMETLTPLIAELAPPDDVLVVQYGGTTSAQNESTLHLTSVREWATFVNDAMAHMPPPNLRRGAFAKRMNWSGVASRWRQAVMLMAACFALWVGNMFVDGLKHQRAADRLTDEATGIFTEAFPGTPVRDLRRQALRRQTSSAGSTFLPLAAHLTAALDLQDSLTLASMRYTEENQLVADLRFPDAGALEALKSALEQRGVRVREGGNLRRDESGNFAGQLFLEARP